MYILSSHLSSLSNYNAFCPLGFLQRVETLMKSCIMWHFIRVLTVYLTTSLGVSCIQRVIILSSTCLMLIPIALLLNTCL